MARGDRPSEKGPGDPPTITSISVAGFKSIGDEQTIEVRPLTLLAGANSSGKSSMMQPLLLLKQTLEALFDPGPLLLNGPYAKFTSIGQFLPVGSANRKSTWMVVGIGISGQSRFAVGLRPEKSRQPEKGKYKISLEFNEYKYNSKSHTLYPSSSYEEVTDFVRDVMGERFVAWKERIVPASKFEVSRQRFILEFNLLKPGISISPILPTPVKSTTVQRLIYDAIHLPGLRGNPERTYHLSAVGPSFPGRFEHYVASLISHWKTEEPEKLRSLGDDLSLLGLTWKVDAKQVDDTQVELRVGRMPRPRRGGAHDLVGIADVGFGVSQTLPVVVALQAARAGQLVYIEQPEIHLHPRAQVAMARLLVNAANRGVRVVAETHSSLLLLGVQSLVAEGAIDPESIKLNWFQRNEQEGTTRITSADLDEAGRFGDWPEDFAEVALEAENRYLSAAEARLVGR
jgi:hypothetical protein